MYKTSNRFMQRQATREEPKRVVKSKRKRMKEFKKQIAKQTRLAIVRRKKRLNSYQALIRELEVQGARVLSTSLASKRLLTIQHRGQILSFDHLDQIKTYIAAL